VLSSARRYRRPVYIELPRDIVSYPIPPIPQIHHDHDGNFQTSDEYKTDIASMQEALEEAAHMINSSKQPVIVAGVEIHRFGFLLYQQF
jgi:TPP-dependent 2-oxoacid decarboxylase